MAFRITRNDLANITADAVIEGSDLNLVSEALYNAKEGGLESVAFRLPENYGETAFLETIDTFRAFLQTSDMEITLVVPGSEAVSPRDEVFAGVDSFLSKNYSEPYSSEDSFAEDEEAVAEDAEAFAQDTGYYAQSAGYYAQDADVALGKSPEPSEEIHKSRKNKSAKRASKLPSPFRFAMKESAPSNPAAGAFCAVPQASRSLSDLMMQVGETWQQSLFRLIDEKGYLDTDVYKRANVDRKLFSKIRSNPSYQPKKITAVAFALALNLSLDETKDFLGRAGYAFSPSSKFDLIIEYFISNEVYDTYTINLALFDHDQPLLGE